MCSTDLLVWRYAFLKCFHIFTLVSPCEATPLFVWIDIVDKWYCTHHITFFMKQTILRAEFKIHKLGSHKAYLYPFAQVSTEKGLGSERCCSSHRQRVRRHLLLRNSRFGLRALRSQLHVFLLNPYVLLKYPTPRSVGSSLSCLRGNYIFVL